MARRNPKYSWLPRHVTTSKGWFVYREWNSEAGRYNPQIKICKIGEPKSKFYEIYEQITGVAPTYTLNWLITKFEQSSHYKELSVNSKKDQKFYFNYLKRYQTSVGTFDQIPLEKLTTPFLQRWHDSLSNRKTTANHLIRYIKMLINWGRSRYEFIKENPAKGVKMFKLKSPSRYVEDWEYKLIYDLAESPWYMRAAMELAYLCCLRSCEIFTLKQADLLEKGILCHRSKGSKSTLVKWSDRLERAVELARNPNAKVRNFEYLFYDDHGAPLKLDALRGAWRRLKKKAKEKDYPVFRFHDLKHKGVTDNKDSNAGGHKDPTMKDLYNQKPFEVEPTK